MLSRLAALAAAIATGLLLIGSDPAAAEGSAKFADGYEGYHLRPPYYLPGIGWHHPPRHRISRAYYFGYHHHPTPGPKIYPDTSRQRYVQPAGVEWCRVRYRSYRASDNSFQPMQGPRRQCCPPGR